MKQKFKSKLILSAALTAVLTFAGCNIFNPTEDVRIASGDAEALTYEGYLHFQKSEYSVARDYFEKAIAADSAYSEAWYGRVKAVLSMQPSLNLFQLISYTRVEEGQNAMSKFLSMPDDQAKSISVGIDSVLTYLDPFIERDTTGRTDKRIRFSNFSNSYTILQMTKMALSVRKAQLNMTNLFSVDPLTGTIVFDWASMSLGELGAASKDAFDALDAMATTLAANPEASVSIMRDYIPGSEYFSDTAFTVALQVFSNQVHRMNESVQNTDVERADVFTSVGNHMDDDGDGCVDEEILDGKDNDGDGEVDEDARPENVIVHEIDIRYHTLDQVKKVNSTGEYQTVDIDGDGMMGEADQKEYKFVIEGSNDRKATGNHLFNFALGLEWYGKTRQEIITSKELVRQDTDINNIKYDLQWRKTYVGGCWVNYDEARFLKWFEGRKVR